MVSVGADPSATCNSAKDTILHSLASSGLEDAGLFLVSVGAKVDAVNNGGETPLHIAGKKVGLSLFTDML